MILGLVSAGLHTWVKVRTGVKLPGHSAVLWLTPLLIGRALASLRGAGTVAATSTAVGLCFFGGLSLRWNVVADFGAFWLVGPALDLYTGLLSRVAERTKHVALRLSGPLAFVWLPLAGLVGNYARLAAKLSCRIIRPHPARLGLPPGVFEFATYLVFGLVAGALAYGLILPLLKRRRIVEDRP